MAQLSVKKMNKVYHEEGDKPLTGDADGSVVHSLVPSGLGTAKKQDFCGKGLDIPTNSIAILCICYHMFALVLLRKASIWLDVPRYGLDVTSQPRLVHGSTDVLSEMFTGSWGDHGSKSGYDLESCSMPFQMVLHYNQI